MATFVLPGWLLLFFPREEPRQINSNSKALQPLTQNPQAKGSSGQTVREAGKMALAEQESKNQKKERGVAWRGFFYELAMCALTSRRAGKRSSLLLPAIEDAAYARYPLAISKR